MTTKSAYEVQAETWAEKWGVRMTVEFTGHRFYFDGDKDTRDTYRVTLTRGERSVSFDYGASLIDSKQCGHSKGAYWDKVRRAEGIRRVEGGKHPIRTRKAPTLYDVLTCLEKYEPGTFEEWCSQFGADTDSRMALETYLKVQQQAQDFVRLCSDPQSDEMMREAQEIQ